MERINTICNRKLPGLLKQINNAQKQVMSQELTVQNQAMELKNEALTELENSLYGDCRTPTQFVAPGVKKPFKL
jgi:hypothetical protein